MHTETHYYSNLPYIAQLAILSYKVDYKNKDEEDTMLPFARGEIWERG